MIEYKGVQGSQVSAPEIEINVDTVYIRTNIQKKHLLSFLSNKQNFIKQIKK